MKSSVHAICFGLLIIVIFGVFIHFSNYFDYKPASTDLAGWMNTAIYFNNVFSPILLLLSILLLYLTWHTSKKQLKESNTFLEEQIHNTNYISKREHLVVLLNSISKKYSEDVEFGSNFSEHVSEQILKGLMPKVVENDPKKYFGLDKKDLNALKITEFLEESRRTLGKVDVINMISIFLRFYYPQNIGERNLKNKAFGAYMLCFCYLSSPLILSNIRMYREFLINSLSTKNDDEFKLLSQIILCQLSKEFIVYLLYDAMQNLKNDENLINDISIINKSFKINNLLAGVYGEYKMLNQALKDA
tara:strand:+ start:1805 stop:2713 length:909 start_codon:yes stop_codon:yes gene_type:complete